MITETPVVNLKMMKIIEIIGKPSQVNSDVLNVVYDNQ